MNFRESASYLLSLGNEVSTMKLGLESITAVLTALGNPQNNFPKVQVAGTNGKGSACAFLDAICRSAGIRSGLYTSPHLVSMTERIRIEGEAISEADFARLATLVRNRCERLVDSGVLQIIPTYFEQVTAIGLAAFAEAGVRLAILETGLGGRLDATTAARAEVAAITRIDLDHQDILGGTIEEIATEKAAIIHENSLVAIGRQRPEAMGILLDRCGRFGIRPLTGAEPGDWKLAEAESGGVRLETSSGAHRAIVLGLKGRHQVENAGVAVSVSQLLKNELGFKIADEHLIAGLERASHPGRLEYIGERYLLDGAHNPSGAKALAAYLDEYEERPVTIIFGAMRDKDIHEATRVLFPRAARVILAVPNNSRAMRAAELLVYADGYNATTANSVAEALTIAEQDTKGLVVVTGSLYLVGEARAILNERFGF